MVIVIDHLERFPSGFDVVTGRGQLWVSAAEGFFFLSGMMIGLIRGRKEAKRPFLYVASALSKRALILYAWCVGLTLLFTWATLQGLTGDYVKPGLWQGSVWDLVAHSVSLQYVYSWADFLKFYAVYLVFSMPTIWLLRHSKAWLVALLSLAVWWGGGHNEFQHWQVLFFLGTVAGWYWQPILSYAKRFPAILTRLHYPVTFITIVLSVVIVEGSLLPQLSQDLNPFFANTSMYAPRVLMFGLWFSAMYRFCATHEEWLHRKVGWFFETLGQNSLYCYIISAFLIYGVHIYIPPSQPIAVNFVITLASVVLVWLAAYKRFLFGIIPR